MSHVLYLSHNGMTEPLGQSQVLPYLRGVSRALGGSLSITLVACEPPTATADQTQAIATALAADHIDYHPLQRRPSTRMIDKARDSLGLWLSGAQTALRAGPCPAIIHARGQLATAVALALRPLFRGARVIYDCRGLLADEYLDMGHWRRGAAPQRITAAAEGHLLRGSDRVVVLTEALQDELRGTVATLGPEQVVHIPCCVDTERFAPRPEARARARAALGVHEDAELLLVFAGSMARYDMTACLHLLAELRAQRPARLLLLTRAAGDGVRAVAQGLGLPDDALRIVCAASSAVPDWLSGGDLAAAFLQPWRSSIATSPTKIGEYLACGLPTAVSADIADGSRLQAPGLFAADPRDRQALRALAQRMLALLADRSAARAAARGTALRHFSLATVGVPRYRQLYEQLLERPAAASASPPPMAVVPERTQGGQP